MNVDDIKEAGDGIVFSPAAEPSLSVFVLWNLANVLVKVGIQSGDFHMVSWANCGESQQDDRNPYEGAGGSAGGLIHIFQAAGMDHRCTGEVIIEAGGGHSVRGASSRREGSDSGVKLLPFGAYSHHHWGVIENK
jgi:hypothetical protein